MEAIKFVENDLSKINEYPESTLGNRSHLKGHQETSGGIWEPTRMRRILETSRDK